MSDERSPVDILEQARSWFAAAWEKVAPDDGIRWSISMAAFPTQTGGMMSFVLSYAEMAGAIMGTSVCNSNVIQPFALTEEHAENTVREQYAGLQTGRSEQLEQMQQQAEEATQRGQRPAASGLILPGV